MTGQNDDDGPVSGLDAIAAAAELDEILGSDDPTGDRTETGEGGKAETGESYIDILEDEVQALQALVEKQAAAVRAADERAVRAQEDVDRAKERLERDTERQVEHRVRKALLSFLDAVDDLDRAIESARTMDHNPAVLQGIELVRQGWLSKLGDFGVTHRPALGVRFDPAIHDGVAQMPTSDPGQDGLVIAVVSEGYDLGDTVLRAAKVAVGKA